MDIEVRGSRHDNAARKKNYQQTLSTCYRHGQSLANKAGVIISSLENGVKKEWALTNEGRLQAQAAGLKLKEKIGKEATLKVFASPFSRTIETAEAAAQGLGVGKADINIAGELRERFFGPARELGSNDRYHEVWRTDEEDPLSTNSGSESVMEVVARLSKFLAKLPKESDAHILLVSHGDTLQILQALMDGATEPSDTRLRQHHKKYDLKTGELRRIDSSRL